MLGPLVVLPPTSQRNRFPDADLILVADRDAKPDRDTNPGVDAARKAALGVEALVAMPTGPGDAIKANQRASYPARLPNPKPTTINPNDSR